MNCRTQQASYDTLKARWIIGVLGPMNSRKHEFPFIDAQGAEPVRHPCQG